MSLLEVQLLPRQLHRQHRRLEVMVCVFCLVSIQYDSNLQPDLPFALQIGPNRVGKALKYAPNQSIIEQMNK
jgi:hypothetical protein